MILIVHTADAKKVFIGLADKDGLVAKKEFQAQYKQAEKLLPEIDKLLKSSSLAVRLGSIESRRESRRAKKKLDQLKGVVVVTGPGPFTALRIGVITANTLSWALKIPTVGLKLTEFKDNTDLIVKGTAKLKKSSSQKIIMPFYGKEPNITKRKNN